MVSISVASIDSMAFSDSTIGVDGSPKREVDRIFCQPFIEKIVQEPAQYDSYYQSKDDRSRYAHDIDVMAKEKISIYGRINDNGQCEDKTYLFSLNLFFIRHGLQVFGIVLR